MGCASTRDDNIWATDVAAHLVYRFNPAGRLEMVLGCKNRPGEWHEYGHLRLFNEPNEAVIGPSGDLFVLQGHGKGKSLIAEVRPRRQLHQDLRQERQRARASSTCRIRWCSTTQGLLYIADRNNARIQVFDADGNYIRESKHPGTPCGLFMAPDQTIWLAHGHTGQIMTLDLNGNVLGVMDGAGNGKTLGKYGEAHYIAVSPRGEVFVADTLNWRVQKYVKRQ